MLITQSAQATSPATVVQIPSHLQRQEHDPIRDLQPEIGFGLATAGLIASFAVQPSRGDLVDLVNRNNRLGGQPLDLQLGYDPVRQLARAGVTFSF